MQCLYFPKIFESRTGPSPSSILSLPECLDLDLCLFSFFVLFDLDLDLDLDFLEPLSSSPLLDSDDELELELDSNELLCCYTSKHDNSEKIYIINNKNQAFKSQASWGMLEMKTIGAEKQRQKHRVKRKGRKERKGKKIYNIKLRKCTCETQFSKEF
jgi:hypothetical protein